MNVAFLQDLDEIAFVCLINSQHAPTAVLFLRDACGIIGAEAAIVAAFLMLTAWLWLRLRVSKSGLESQPAKQEQTEPSDAHVLSLIRVST